MVLSTYLFYISGYFGSHKGYFPFLDLKNLTNMEEICLQTLK